MPHWNKNKVSWIFDEYKTNETKLLHQKYISSSANFTCVLKAQAIGKLKYCVSHYIENNRYPILYHTDTSHIKPKPN